MRARAVLWLLLVGAASCAEQPLPETRVTVEPPETAAAPAAPTAPVPPAVQPAPDDPWRRTSPAPGPAPQVKLPALRQKTLANGLEILVVEAHHLPIVSMRLVVFAGAERTSRRQAGLADLCAALLREGTARHDAIGLAEAIESLGAALQTGADYDAAWIDLDALSQKLDPALDLFVEVVTTPSFPDREIERVRDERKTALLQQKDQPGTIARNVAHRLVYGADHPYAYPLIGTESSLAALGRKEIVAFWRAHYRPGNARLIVVGDVTLADVVAKIEPRLAGWKGGGGAARGQPPGLPAWPASRRVHLVDKPQATQSVIEIAHAGVARSSPDYIPLLVANYVLGGTFSSRINMNLRERKGYSYGARSGFAFYRGPGPFTAGGNVRGEATKDALFELVKELSAIRDRPLGEAELAEAKASLIGKLPAGFETNTLVAARLGELVVNGLPLDWYAHFTEKVQAVTAADVQRVARRYIRPDRAQVVVVGDRQAIEEGLRALGLGPVERRGPLGERL